MTDKVSELFFSGQPPCQNACPLQMDVRGYVNLSARGMYEEALALIKETNPLPSICGRVCHHPCELSCRRGQHDGSVAIKDIKRFAADNAIFTESGDRRTETGKKVAVVGAGPAGLTAAWELNKLGYVVTVFEKEEHPGGVLAYGIPEYRLPLDVILRDTSSLAASGVEFKHGFSLGGNLSFEELKSNHDAVILALGLAKSRLIPVPGIELPGVLPALPFLKNCRLKEKTGIGKRVVVVGGGNVAVDVARSAVRCGAEEVTMVCLEKEHEMPAFAWEIEEAREEGVKINCAWGPVEIMSTGGKASGLKVKQCSSVFDENGRFNPSYCEDVIEEIPGDTVILAIGQGQDDDVIKPLGLPLDERGRAATVPGSRLWTENIYICGEIALGPSTVSEAMSDGRKTAWALHLSFSGDTLSYRPVLPYQSCLPDLKKKRLQKEKTVMPKLMPAARKDNFEEIEQGYLKAVARSEAGRCLTCLEEVALDKDKCVSCFTCLRVCPLEVPGVCDGYPVFDTDRCSGCGVCFSECPVYALSFKNSWESRLYEYIVELVAGGKEELVLGCDLDRDEADLRVPCLARLASVFYLKLLLIPGLSRLSVNVCRDKECRYGEEKRILEGKLRQAARLVEETNSPVKLELREEEEGDA